MVADVLTAALVAGYGAQMSELPISVQDALWLNMDRPNNLMIIDSVLWFTEQPDWDAVKAVIDEMVGQARLAVDMIKKKRLHLGVDKVKARSEVKALFEKAKGR